VRKGRLSLILAVLVSALCLVACASDPPAAKSGDEAAIKAVFDKYVSTLVSKDADGWMALWDEGGVQLPPNESMHVGKAAISEANYDGIKLNPAKMEMFINTQEVIVFGDGYAVARGVYGWKMTPPDGGAGMDYDGKFMTIFKKQADGSWKIFRDCFNSNRA
jgi:uncharacterized protein (TIGR02246 family)